MKYLFAKGVKFAPTLDEVIFCTFFRVEFIELSFEDI